MALAITYGTYTAITWTLAALATSSTLLAGRTSTLVDNTSAQLVDYIVGGTITGPATATAGFIEIRAYGTTIDLTTYTGGIAGADADKTLIAETKQLLVPVITIPTNAVASQVYAWGPIPMSVVFNGVIPPKWGLWLTHSTSNNLTSGSAYYSGITFAG